MKKVADLQRSGKSIINFTIGEPDIDTPSHIVSAAIAALQKGATRYTSPGGTLELREAIVAKFQRENGLTYIADNVVVGSGAKQIIYEAFAATLEEGDEVVIPAPYWVSYPDIAALNGATPVIIPCGEDTGFKLTADLLRNSISPRTRWVVLNSPNNPTGAVYSPAELAALAEVLDAHPQVWVLTDDIYEHIVFSGSTYVNLLSVAPQLASRTLIINGVSKAYAMTGWRIGYAAGPSEIIQPIIKLIGQSTSCASSVSQAAAAAALTGDQSCVAEAAQLYQRKRDVMLDRLGRVRGLTVIPPEGAFYCFASVQGLIGSSTPQGVKMDSDLDVRLYLLEAANVAVLDGAAYGMSPYIRLSFATSIALIEEGCERIARACEALS